MWKFKGVSNHSSFLHYNSKTIFNLWGFSFNIFQNEKGVTVKNFHLQFVTDTLKFSQINIDVWIWQILLEAFLIWQSKLAISQSIILTSSQSAKVSQRLDILKLLYRRHSSKWLFWIWNEQFNRGTKLLIHFRYHL